MSDPNLPSETPNVVLANPAVRKALNWIVGLAAVILPIAGIIDGSSDALDWSAVTIPATGVTSFLAGLLGLTVTIPNIPSKR